MSYDKSVCSTVLLPRVSIPLEQGNLLRRKRVGKYGGASSSQSLWNRAMSYDSKPTSCSPYVISQSLWNRAMSYDQQSSTTKGHFGVSIPLEQGNVLRPCTNRLLNQPTKSQSLWNRAMSYDGYPLDEYVTHRKSQSLWNRAMSYDMK